MQSTPLPLQPTAASIVSKVGQSAIAVLELELVAFIPWPCAQKKTVVPAPLGKSTLVVDNV
jgi:hypothetical protein